MQTQDVNMIYEVQCAISEQFGTLRESLIQEMTHQQESFLALLRKDLIPASQREGQTHTIPMPKPGAGVGLVNQVEDEFQTKPAVGLGSRHLLPQAETGATHVMATRSTGFVVAPQEQEQTHAKPTVGARSRVPRPEGDI